MENVIYERPNRAGGLGNDQEHFLITSKASLKDRICLSNMVRYVVPAFVVMTLLMVTVYTTMYLILKNSDNDWPATCNIRPSYRIECLPGRNETVQISFDDCMAVGCCWHDASKLCFHSIPSRHGYTPKNSETYKENEMLVPRTSRSPLGSKNAESIVVELKNVDANHVKVTLKISQTATRDSANVKDDGFKRGKERFSTSKETDTTDKLSRKLLYFLPENPVRRTVNIQDDVKSNLNVYFHSPEFSLTVTRKNDTSAHPLLSTARGPLILTENFWEFTLYITNRTIYGLNQLQLNGTSNMIYNNENGTATPAFVGIDDNGQGTSCYISYDGPMEIQILDESNLIVLRGLSLPREISLNVFAGPTPREAVRQLTKALQKDSQIRDMPLSNLGLHVCPNDNSIKFIENLKATIDSMNGPWDSHCLHQGFNPTLGNSLNESHSKIVIDAITLLANEGGGGRVLVPHLTPMVFFSNNSLATQLIDSSLVLSNSSGPYVGLYRNRSVVYPDWFDSRTFEISLSNLTDYLTNFAASKLLYVRDSWPKDETKGHLAPTNRYFDYVPKELTRLMSNGTVPYSLLTSSRTNFHYVKHNAYSEKFRNTSMLQGWMSLTIRGLWGESGNSSWAALREAVRVGVGSCVVGQLPPPMYICGSAKDLGPSNNNDELCSRWYGAAVVWPHVLVLPENLPGGIHLTMSASTYAIKHLKLRASLLTYTRTTLAKHNLDGSPLLAPTSIYYPNDLRVRNRWDQFLWGDSILVGLVTLPRVSQVLMWLPGEYPWRHLHGGSKVYPSNSTDTSITAGEGQIVSLIRPGYIVPLHKETSMTSDATLKNDLTLVINLACDDVCFASGRIFYGKIDGAFLNINASNTTLELSNVLRVKEQLDCNSGASKQQATVIKYVEILGTSIYTINTELCSLQNDNESIIFDDTQKS